MESSMSSPCNVRTRRAFPGIFRLVASCAVLVVGISSVFAADPLARLKQNVADLRARYPFESLDGRLQYELKYPAWTPTLTADTIRRLDAQEKTLVDQARGDLRLQSLKMLHSSHV